MFWSFFGTLLASFKLLSQIGRAPTICCSNQSQHPQPPPPRSSDPRASSRLSLTASFRFSITSFPEPLSECFGTLQSAPDQPPRECPSESNRPLQQETPGLLQWPVKASQEPALERIPCSFETHDHDFLSNLKKSS